MKNGVRMIDIAEKLGVSVVTVSNALAGRDGVSDSVRRKICDTAGKMGYKPSNTGKSHKKNIHAGIGRSIAILTSERFVGDKGTFYWKLTANISNRLSAMNILTVYECITRKNERNCIIPSTVSEHKVDGVIIIGQLRRDFLFLISKSDIPVVCVDFYVSRCELDSVNSDSYYGGYIITDHLVERGHRKIGFIGNINATSSINDRFLGYIKCLIENKLEIRREWFLEARDDTGTLFERISFPEDMPTAFVCNSDETAFRVISALRQKGVRVPEDISIVGYDNYIVSNICVPAITTVEVDIEQMASESVDIMLKKLGNPDYREGRKIISGKLVVKDSTIDIG